MLNMAVPGGVEWDDSRRAADLRLQDTRSAISQVESPSEQPITVLADSQRKKLNNPNDLVYKSDSLTRDHSLWVSRGQRS